MGRSSQLSARLDSTLANPALARTLNRTDTLTGNLADDRAAHLHRRAARHPAANINQGQGTLGKFATDSGFYTDCGSCPVHEAAARRADEASGEDRVTIKLLTLF